MTDDILLYQVLKAKMTTFGVLGTHLAFFKIKFDETKGTPKRQLIIYFNKNKHYYV